MDYLRGRQLLLILDSSRAPDRCVREAGRTGAALRGPGDRSWPPQPPADERAGRALLPGAAAAGPRTRAQPVQCQPVQCQPVQCQPGQCRPGRCQRGGASRGGAGRGRAGRGGCGDAVNCSPSGPRQPHRLRGHAGRPPRCDPAVRPAGRHPAGDRAGRGAAAHPELLWPLQRLELASACSRPATAGPCRTSRRCAPPRNGATTYAGGGAAALGAAVGVRRVVRTSPPPRRYSRAGHWPARRHPAHPDRPGGQVGGAAHGGGPRAVLAAGHHPRVRGRTAGRAARRRGRHPRPSTSRTSAPWRANSAATPRTTTSSSATTCSGARHPDLRAALGYALGQPPAPGKRRRGRRPAPLLGDLRPAAGGKHWLTKILLRFPGPSPERAWLLMTRGVLSTLQGELGEAVADLELSTPWPPAR